VAVTGGTGFVGSHLVDTLCAAGLSPRVLVRDPAAPRWIARRPAEFVGGSLEDTPSLLRLVRGAGTVIHLAGTVRAAHTAEFDRGNRCGTARLVASVVEAAPAARLVYVSSLAAVGPSPGKQGVGPDATPRPVSEYGRSKLAAEREVGRAGWWTIVRPPAIYGPRDTDILQFFRMIRSGLAAVPLGARWITVAHVADVVRGILAAGAAPSGRVYHLGEPQPYRLDVMLRRMAAAGGYRVRLVPVPVTAVMGAGVVGSVLGYLGMARVALTLDKARELTARHWVSRVDESSAGLGISSWVPFAEGATATWTWYRGQGWLS
jgi:nucleoside-diphosphate-sugar epimerase